MISVILGLGAKIFPLYINILLGFFASRKLNVSRESIAPLLVYILSPVVVFHATLRVEIVTSVVLLPIIIFILAVGVCSITYAFAGKFYKNRTKNILAFSAGTGNTGYFGIPLALILLSEETANLFIFTILVSFIFEYTVGFFVVSKGSYTIKQSLAKIFKVPVLYALGAGLLCNYLDVSLNDSIVSFLDYFKGAYAILGMMMIGMGLQNIKDTGIDKKFISIALFAKFIIWPLFAILIIWLDSSFFMLLNASAYQVLILYSIVPMAANVVTLATLFKIEPEQAAVAVLISTLLAFFIIPIVAANFL